MIKGYELRRYNIMDFPMAKHRREVADFNEELARGHGPEARAILREARWAWLHSAWGLASLN